MSGSPHDFAADAFHAGQLYRSCFRELTESCGFTPNEMFVLLFLYRNAPEQDTATVIAQAWNVSKPLVTRSVDGLQKRGLLYCVRDENDRRLVHLHLSDEGHAAAKTLHHRCETFALTLQQGISEQEMQTLCSVMQKMRAKPQRFTRKDKSHMNNNPKGTKNPKKPLIFYYAVMLLVLMMLNWLLFPSLLQRQVTEVGYDEFIVYGG